MFLNQSVLLGIYAGSNAPRVQLSDFSITTTTGTIQVNWGDETSETLTSGTPVNHIFRCLYTSAPEGIWNNVQPCI